MTWTIKYLASLKKPLRKITPADRQRIRRFLEDKLAHHDNPRALGRRLVGTQEALWRYRVGNYRIICEIQDSELTILAIKVAHRSTVYK
jgi:mRNA interferase RelE/StbE